MAKKIEFSDLFLERLQSAPEEELRRIAENLDLALRLRFNSAAVAQPKRRGRPRKASAAESAAAIE